MQHHVGNNVPNRIYFYELPYEMEYPWDTDYVADYWNNACNRLLGFSGKQSWNGSLGGVGVGYMMGVACGGDT